MKGRVISTPPEIGWDSNGKVNIFVFIYMQYFGTVSNPDFCVGIWIAFFLCGLVKNEYWSCNVNLVSFSFSEMLCLILEKKFPKHERGPGNRMARIQTNNIWY